MSRPSPPGHETPEAGAEERRARRSQRISWLVTGTLLSGLCLYLAIARPPRGGATVAAPASSLAVEVAPDGRIRLPDAPAFSQRLERVAVVTRRSSVPILEVTGTLMAAIPAGEPRGTDRWQFATSDLLNTYAEWSQSTADVAFRGQALASSRKLVEARVAAQTKVVERLKKLVDVGSDSARDLALEEANLLQTRLEGERAQHEADNELRAAQRKQTALARQLEQSGLAPDLLREGQRGRALLVAEIPESRIDRVREGEACAARFYGRPGAPFAGTVARVLPTVSAIQRTLRVVVVLENADDTLRPGMFADVGVGTDARDALFVPAASVLHVGRADYALVVEAPLELSVREVVVGDAQGGEVEVLRGLEPTSAVVGGGAILLKTSVIEALRVRGAR